MLTAIGILALIAGGVYFWQRAKAADARDGYDPYDPPSSSGQ